MATKSPSKGKAGKAAKPATMTKTEFVKEWSGITNRLALATTTARLDYARLVFKASKAGHSNSEIAKWAGKSVGEIGKLLSAGIADNAGMDGDTVFRAIDNKAVTATVSRITEAANFYKDPAELKVALEEMGITPKEKSTPEGKGKGKGASVRNTNDVAIEDINTIRQRIIDGKLDGARLVSALEACLKSAKSASNAKAQADAMADMGEI